MARDYSEQFAIAGMTSISTANTNLDGTGTLGTVLIAPSAPGAKDVFIQGVIIKATGNTTQGMVRLFIEDLSGNKRLIEEFPIPGNTQAATLMAFQTLIYLDAFLEPGYKLLASTEKGENFNVIALGGSWSYSGTEQQIIFASEVGMSKIDTANSNLDGTGAMSTIISGRNNGMSVSSLDIKAIMTTKQGMVRLFLDDTSSTKLIWEIAVPFVTQASVTPTFGISADLVFALPNNWTLKASTQSADSFQVIASGNDWSYSAL